VWSRRRGSLMWVDIEGRVLHELRPEQQSAGGGSAGRLDTWQLPERSGTVALTNKPNRVLLAMEGGLAEFDLCSTAMRRRIQEGFEEELPTTRPNDGRVDREGRLIFGGYNEAHRNDGGKTIAGVYRLSSDMRVERLLPGGVRVANSICFSPDGGTFYFSDSPDRRILAFPYNAGEDLPLTTAPRVLYAMPAEEDGFPDGATVDSQGGVWSAQFGMYRVVRHRPTDGSIDTVVSLPVPNPTCVALGGADLSTLFITTTRRKMTDAELQKVPSAGGVFAVRVLVPGIAEPEFLLPPDIC